MKKFLIICLLMMHFLSTWASGEGKAGLGNVVNSNLKKSTVNGFKSLQVNDMFSGAGVFRVGIDLPEGIKKDNLDLSLSYNSYSTDSFNPYGYAWNINLQTITRNTKKGVDNLYKSNDFFADGNDLILVDSVNNIYKQKNTGSLTKYIFENGSWKVIDTNGNTYYYGNDGLSKLDHPTDKSKVFAWYLTKKLDSRGNEVNYSYFKDNNQVYLKEINYVYLNSTPLYSIKFNYLDKKISSTSYRTQFEVKTSKLLSDIKIYVSSELKKQYNFTYDSIINPFSHLTKVELVSGDKTFQKYDFTYGTGKDMHLLTNIKTPNGLNVDFTYKPAVSYKQDGKNLNTKLPFNVKTLSNITYTDTITNNTLSEDYTYAGGYYYYNSLDIYGREYAGFHKVEKKDSVGKTEVYYFHQGQCSYDGSNLGEFEDDISKKGMIYRYELKDNSGSTYSQKITKWDKKVNTDGTLKVLPIQEVEVMKDGTSKTITYAYDNYGQLLEEKRLGLVRLLSPKGDFEDISGDEKTIQKTYAINPEKNLYNYVSSEQVLDKDNNEVLKKEYFFDNLTSTGVTFGDLTDTKSYVDSTKYVEEKNEYDNKGLLTKTINPNGFATNIEYDQYGLFAIKIINAKLFEENYVYDYAIGKPSSFTDVNGINYTYTYDTLGRNLSENVIDNGSKTLKSYVYDDISIPNSIKETAYLNAEGSDSVVSYYYLDSLGNPIQAKRKYKDKYVTSYMAYDSYGRKTYDYYKKYENTSLFTNNTLDLKGDKYTYDVLDRIVNINNASGDVRYTYFDLGFTVYNQKNIPTKYTYDIDGNLVEVVETGDIKTNYSYNAIGNLININRLGQYKRNFTYDMLGRRTKAEELHKIGTTSLRNQLYVYDDNSNIITKTTLSGNDINYTYDNLDRLVRTYSVDTDVSYTYDEGVNNKARLTGIDKGIYKEKYNYDLYGQLTEDRKIYTDKEYLTINEYPFLGLKKSTTYPDGKKTIYNYVEGVAEGISYDGKNLTTSIDYNPNFYIEKLVYGNPNLEEVNTYDYLYNYRLGRKTLNKKDGEIVSKLSDITYEYDNLGNIIISKELGNKSQFQKEVTYTYDDNNRLTNASYTSSGVNEELSYNYDNLGNITYNSKKGNYNYNLDLPEKLENIVDSNSLMTSYDYDNNGNITNEGIKNYIYNSRDELVSFQNGTGSVTNYIYDEGGIRVEKSSSGIIDRYINKEYEEEKSCHNELVSESGSETQEICSTKITKFIDINGKKIATVETVDNNPDKIIYHQDDYLGGASIDLDENLNTLQIVDFYPYGKLRQEDNSENYKDKYLYSGKERDQENGLDYFEARYYDSEVGRFRSIDRVYWEVGITERGKNTLFTPQSQNAYSYAGNNPIIYTDPSGENRTILGFFGSIIGLEHCGDESTAQKYQDQEDAFYPVLAISAGTAGAVGIAKSIEKGVEKVIKKEITAGAKKEVKVIEKTIAKKVENSGGKIFGGIKSPNIVREKGNIYYYTGTRKEFDRYFEKLTANKSKFNYLDLREKSKGFSNGKGYDGPPTIDIKEGGNYYKIKFKGQ